MNAWKNMPKRVKLLNTGMDLAFKVEHLPFLNGFNEHVRLDGPELLNITRIPTDEIKCEPIVIEIEW